MNVCMCGGLVPHFPFGVPFLCLSKSSYSDLFSYTYMFVQHTLGYLLRMESKWWFWWWLLKQKTRWRNEAWSTDKLPTIPPFFLALKHHTKKTQQGKTLKQCVRMWECEWHKNHHQGKKISSRVLLSKSKLNKGKEKKNLIHSLIIFCLFLPPSYSFVKWDQNVATLCATTKFHHLHTLFPLLLFSSFCFSPKDLITRRRT